MNTPREHQPLVVQKVKLRWWAISFVPLALALYLAMQGMLPVALIAMVMFFGFFWLSSFVVALVIILFKRQPRGPLQ